VNQQYHFWGYASKEMKSVCKRDICTPMFTDALFTSQTRKQPKRSIGLQYIRISIQSQKEWHPIICNSMNGSGRHVVKWNSIPGRDSFLEVFTFSFLCYVTWDAQTIVNTIESWEENGGDHLERVVGGEWWWAADQLERDKKLHWAVAQWDDCRQPYSALHISQSQKKGF
jgi:hypothetical protein